MLFSVFMCFVFAQIVETIILEHLALSVLSFFVKIIETIVLKPRAFSALSKHYSKFTNPPAITLPKTWYGFVCVLHKNKNFGAPSIFAKCNDLTKNRTPHSS